MKNGLESIGPEKVATSTGLSTSSASIEECARMKPFTKAGKAVFQVEYKLAPAAFCARRSVSASAPLRKRFTLGAWRRACG